MSQQPPNPFSNQPSFSQPLPPEYHQAPTNNNSLGLSGFIVSLVGLVLCGIPSLIGLVLSAMGLRKEPRGLAIAGVIIGLIGLVELAGFVVMTYQGIHMVKNQITEVTSMLAEAQLEQAAADIGNKWEELERIPTQEEGDDMLIGRNDMMNNSLIYQTDGTSFSIRSAGADGILETEDDIVVGPFEDPQTAIDLETNFDDWEAEAEEEDSVEVEEASEPSGSRDLLED